jgi:cytochrome oxidase Cu insertion factor (SCO1/SenC/PrrC family)
MVSASPQSSSSPAVSFDLIDHEGRPVSAQSYHGRFAAIFFGFTHCRLVCPRALTRLSAALDALGPLSDQIQPIYITVDPERDTPERMRSFLQSYPRFTGLTGSHEQIVSAKQAFRVFAEMSVDPTSGDDYVIRHTAITYVLDRDGELVSHFLDGLSAEAIAERLRSLLIIDGPPDMPV